MFYLHYLFEILVTMNHGMVFGFDRILFVMMFRYTADTTSFFFIDIGFVGTGFGMYLSGTDADDRVHFLIVYEYVCIVHI